MEYKPVDRAVNPEQVAAKYDLRDIRRALYIRTKYKIYDVTGYNETFVEQLAQYEGAVLLGAEQIKLTTMERPRTTIFDNSVNVLAQSELDDAGIMTCKGAPIVNAMGFLISEKVLPDEPLDKDVFKTCVMAAQFLTLVNGVLSYKIIPDSKIFSMKDVFRTTGTILAAALHTIVSKVMKYDGSVKPTLKGKELASELYRRIMSLNPEGRQALIKDVIIDARAHLNSGFFDAAGKVYTPKSYNSRVLNFSTGDDLVDKFALASKFLDDMRAMRGNDQKDMTIFGNCAALPYNVSRPLANAMYMSSAIKVFVDAHPCKFLKLRGVGNHLDMIMSMMGRYLKLKKIEDLSIDKPNQMPGLYGEQGYYVSDAYAGIRFHMESVKADLTINFNTIEVPTRAGLSQDVSRRTARLATELGPLEIRLIHVDSEVRGIYPYKSPHNLVAFVFGTSVKPPPTLIRTSVEMSAYLQLSMDINFIRNFPYVARAGPYEWLVQAKYPYVAVPAFCYTWLKKIEEKIVNNIRSVEFDYAEVVTDKTRMAANDDKRKSAVMTQEEYATTSHYYDYKDIDLVRSEIIMLDYIETTRFITRMTDDVWYEHSCSRFIDSNMRALPRETNYTYECDIPQCCCDRAVVQPPEYEAGYTHCSTDNTNTATGGDTAGVILTTMNLVAFDAAAAKQEATYF
jgi:hypothetical protein